MGCWHLSGPTYWILKTLPTRSRSGARRSEETATLLQSANRLAGIGLKTKDALHIACASAGECTYFVTLVLHAGSTTWEHARRAVAHFMTLHMQTPLNAVPQQATSHRGQNLELVLNFLDPLEEDSYGYYWYHNYYYEHGKASDKV